MSAAAPAPAPAAEKQEVQGHEGLPIAEAEARLVAAAEVAVADAAAAVAAQTASPVQPREGPLADFLEMLVKGSRKYKAYWFTLVGSSLFFYKSQNDTEPKGVIELRGATVATESEKLAEDGRDRYSFEVRTAEENGGRQFTLRSATEAKAHAWSQALQNVREESAHDAPTKESVAKPKRPLSYRAKKGMGSKLVGSSLGKQSINQILDDEVKGMVKALRNLVEADAGKAYADFVEEALFKIIFKCYCEWDRKKVTLEQFLEMDKPLRRAFHSIDKLFGIWGWTPSDEQLQKDFLATEAAFREAGQILQNLMTPYLHTKNILMIQELFEYVGSAKFLMHMWHIRDEETTKDAIFDLMVAMRLYYTHEYQPVEN
eukprot:m51a1_g3316 hypothetical protein (373) ;mRNA; f:344731-346501